MQKRNRSLVLSNLEVWSVSLVALALLLAGESHLLLQKLGLMSSSAIVSGQVSSKVGSGLQVLDSFRITAGLVTFMVWGVVGLITLSIIRGIMQATGTIKFESELSSNRYVHPQGFDRDRFWKRVVVDTTLSFVLLLLLIAGAVAYVAIALPFSLNHARRFILSLSASTIINLLVGFVIIIFSTLALYYLLKLVMWHHRVSQQ